MSSHLVRDLRLISICNFNVEVAADRILSDASPSLATDGPINVFYTLHNIKNILLYVSEVAVAYSGVDFGAVSLPDLGRRLYKVKICIWIKALDQETWTLFHKLKVDVRNLIEVGNLADRDRESLFVTNTLLWRFNDIYYCLRADLKDSSAMEKTRQLSWNRARGTKPSYTVNDIRQLTSLYIGIREFAEVKKTLGAQIAELSQMINKTPDSDIPERIRSLKFDLHTLHKYIVRQNSAIDALLSEVYLKKLHIGRSTHIIEKDFPHFKEMCSERLEIAAAQIEPLQESLNLSVYPNLISTLQEVGMVLIDTYPIELMASGRFSICGIEFPMSIREILDFCYYGHSESRSEMEVRVNMTKAESTVQKLATAPALLSRPSTQDSHTSLVDDVFSRPHECLTQVSNEVWALGKLPRGQCLTATIISNRSEACYGYQQKRENQISTLLQWRSHSKVRLIRKSQQKLHTQKCPV
ncbi:CIC11C00000004069 [Sungouiella intermedia]|uniref:CIC11C00000004069 n=1 Tax=Sungouiella intermedia TaxID=45354 RepID=A0A1L0C5P9_9ASCO|nr:CIC11C00000004069 [[Candida] intermedia]